MRVDDFGMSERNVNVDRGWSLAGPGEGVDALELEASGLGDFALCA